MWIKLVFVFSYKHGLLFFNFLTKPNYVFSKLLPNMKLYLSSCIMVEKEWLAFEDTMHLIHARTRLKHSLQNLSKWLIRAWYWTIVLHPIRKNQSIILMSTLIFRILNQFKHKYSPSKRIQLIDLIGVSEVDHSQIHCS